MRISKNNVFISDVSPYEKFLLQEAVFRYRTECKRILDDLKPNDDCGDYDYFSKLFHDLTVLYQDLD